VVNAHVTGWRIGTSTPAAPALDAMYARWKALPVGEELRVDWPSQWIPRITADHHRRGISRRPTTPRGRQAVRPEGQRAAEQRHSAAGAPRRS
jgi:hypothetical protein